MGLRSVTEGSAFQVLNVEGGVTPCWSSAHAQRRGMGADAAGGSAMSWSNGGFFRF